MVTETPIPVAAGTLPVLPGHHIGTTVHATPIASSGGVGDLRAAHVPAPHALHGIALFGLAAPLPGQPLHARPGVRAGAAGLAAQAPFTFVHA